MTPGRARFDRILFRVTGIAECALLLFCVFVLVVLWIEGHPWRPAGLAAGLAPKIVGLRVEVLRRTCPTEARP